MPKRWKEGRLIAKDSISNNTKHFTIQVEDSIFENFYPGQFITMDLPIGEKRLDRWRSYSIAGIDKDNSTLDLSIVKLHKGKASTYLNDQIQIGETISFKGPEGQFILPENLDQTIVMICTGTGVAPFRAMIRDIIQKNMTPKKVHLIFGSRTKNDILYKDEFEAYQKEFEWFNYSISLSREDWDGRRGYVHEIYKDQYQKPAKDITFMLCGWSMMVDEAKDILLNKLGFEPKNVLYELYG